MRRCFLVLVFASAIMLLPETSVAQSSAVRQIAAESARFDSAFAEGDLETQAALLTDESMVVSGGGAWTGRAQILELHVSLHTRRPGITLVTEPDSILIGPDGWDVASEHGIWIERWVQSGEQVDLRGRYQAMWRFVDGRWRRAALMLVPLNCSGPYCVRQ